VVIVRRIKRATQNQRKTLGLNPPMRVRLRKSEENQSAWLKAGAWLSSEQLATMEERA